MPERRCLTLCSDDAAAKGEGICCSRTFGVRPEGWTRAGSDPL